MENSFTLILILCVVVVFISFLIPYLAKTKKNNIIQDHHLSHSVELRKDVIKMRVQAYERLVVLLERVSPVHILSRVSPVSNKVSDYKQFLTETIEQEFHHNLSQQIYISEDSWTAIRTAVNTAIQQIRTIDEGENLKDANAYRTLALQKLATKKAPTLVALSILKKEASAFFN